MLMLILKSLGYPPFSDKSRHVQDQLIINCKYEFQEDTFGMVSQDTKDLIASLLVIDPRARFSASKALKHPWFKIDRKSLKICDLTECQKSIKVYLLKEKFTSAVNKVSNKSIYQGFNDYALYIESLCFCTTTANCSQQDSNRP
jgi:serine/threonine protein kinase